MKNPIDIRQLATDVLAGIAPEADLSTVGDHEDLREALDYLDAHAGEKLLLVSHQPFIGELAGLLQHGHRQAPLPMKTASLAELQGWRVNVGTPGSGVPRLFNTLLDVNDITVVLMLAMDKTIAIS